MSNCVKKEPCRMRLATFNIGDYTNFEKKGFYKNRSPELAEAYREVFRAVGADLWAFQEDAEYYNPEQELGPYEALYSDYQHYERRFTGPYNGKAFLSNLEIRDAEQIYYECTKRIGHKWFLRATVTLGDKEVCLINVHLDWGDNDSRHEQIQQVIDCAKQYEYCIIMGDFNPDDYIDGQQQSKRCLLEDEVKYFTNAGFISANAGAFGMISTYVHKGGISIDNILVSGNMRIENAGNLQTDWMNDHIPFWADIVID